MNKEQANIELVKIFDDRNKQAKKIEQESKKNGTWKMGLDSNKALFAELDKKTMEMINCLKSLIDE